MKKPKRTRWPGFLEILRIRRERKQRGDKRKEMHGQGGLREEHPEDAPSPDPQPRIRIPSNRYAQLGLLISLLALLSGIYFGFRSTQVEVTVVAPVDQEQLKDLKYQYQSLKSQVIKIKRDSYNKMAVKLGIPQKVGPPEGLKIKGYTQKTVADYTRAIRDLEAETLKAKSAGEREAVAAAKKIKR